MTSEQATETSRHSQLDADAVGAYLAANPDFFLQHLDLVARLKIPHPTRGAVSLIEYQVAVLRDKLEREQRRLAHLIARARDYEDFSERLHTLTLQLIAAPDIAHTRTVLEEGLQEAFHADAVTLKLFPRVAHTAEQDPVALAFLEFADRPHTLCGPLKPAKGAALFGDQCAEPVRSAALIPLHADSHFGVLAVGSREPERFDIETGTELLDRLGRIVSQKLMVLDLQVK